MGRLSHAWMTYTTLRVCRTKHLRHHADDLLTFFLHILSFHDAWSLALSCHPACLACAVSSRDGARHGCYTLTRGGALGGLPPRGDPVSREGGRRWISPSPSNSCARTKMPCSRPGGAMAACKCRQSPSAWMGPGGPSSPVEKPPTKSGISAAIRVPRCASSSR